MFNKKLFSSLLTEIKSKQSLNEYARQSGVSAAYISKLIRELNDSPPSPEIIKKLSLNYIGMYKQLMAAAGHIAPFDEDYVIQAKIKYILEKKPELDSKNFGYFKHGYYKLSPEEITELDQYIESSSTEQIESYLDELRKLIMKNQDISEVKENEDTVGYKISDPKEDKKIRTIAAHIDDDVTEEELKDIMNYIEFLKNKRK
ncbi:hypothetical protein JMA_27490 [Jeotgalibacillus malaysiensis]|uniref:Uncharacterized protein n=1 Tax=Jeotgalibacillus malaysiensis TaxID=1508404 RepID=A0A0B5APN6_9BACL|nr:hypothetical protein JMA_27490 [Jeotgalibacillus malaysiensis]